MATTPKTVAEEQLEQQKAQSDPTAGLKEQAKEQKKAQREQLREGRKSGAPKQDGPPAAKHASDHVASFTRGGDRPDQLSIENPVEEVAYGHFCTVVDGEHEGRFGVYEDTVATGNDGKPTHVRVRTRDADNAVFTVPYDSIRPAESRGNAPR